MPAISVSKNRPAEVSRKPRNFHHNRGIAVEQMDHLDPSTFKRMFQVDRSTFDELLDIITSHLIQLSEVKAKNSSGSSFSAKTQLAIMLHWLAGGSHLDDAFALGFPINDLDRLTELTKGFYDHSGAILDACVLAVDGLEMPLQEEDSYTEGLQI